MFELKIKEVNVLKCPKCKQGRIKRQLPGEIVRQTVSIGGCRAWIELDENCPKCDCCGTKYQVSFHPYDFTLELEEL